VPEGREENIIRFPGQRTNWLVGNRMQFSFPPLANEFCNRRLLSNAVRRPWPLTKNDATKG